MSTLHVENLKGLTSGGNANKVIIPSGQTLDASNGLTTPAGHDIQFLSQEITAYTGTGSTSLVATGFTLTITPKSTASKIKCTVGFNGLYANTVGSAVSIQLYKDGSSLAWLENVVCYAHPSGYAHQANNPTLMHVDSPNTTSAVTYAIFFARAGGSGNVYFNNYVGANNQTRSWFTVEEIAQ